MAARIGAKVDAPNRMGETPLIIAVQQRERDDRRSACSMRAPTRTRPILPPAIRPATMRSVTPRPRNPPADRGEEAEAVGKPPLIAVAERRIDLRRRVVVRHGERNAEARPSVVQAQGAVRRFADHGRVVAVGNDQSGSPGRYRSSSRMRARCGGTAQKKRSQ